MCSTVQTIFVLPPILIDIDPGISGGFIHGRFDLVIRGRIAAAGPIEEATLLVDDALVARAQFGDPQRAAPATLPDGSEGRQRAFQFSVPMLQDAAQGARRCVIMARVGDSQTHTEAFELAVEPAASPPISLVSGPTQPVHAYDGVRPPVVLYVERAAIDSDGQLTVHGWAVAATRVITIQVFVDETRIAAAKTGIEREDVGNSYPNYPNNRLSGFNLATTLREEEREATAVRVQAICLKGFSCEVIVPVERIGAGAPSQPAQPAPAQLHRSSPIRSRQSPRHSSARPSARLRPCRPSACRPRSRSTSSAPASCWRPTHCPPWSPPRSRRRPPPRPPPTHAATSAASATMPRSSPMAPSWWSAGPSARSASPPSRSTSTTCRWGRPRRGSRAPTSGKSSPPSRWPAWPATG